MLQENEKHLFKNLLQLNTCNPPAISSKQRLKGSPPTVMCLVVLVLMSALLTVTRDVPSVFYCTTLLQTALMLVIHPETLILERNAVVAMCLYIIPP